MIERQLLSELDLVAARFRQLYFWRFLAATWLTVAAGGLALWFARTIAPWPIELIALLLGSLVVASVAIGLVTLRRSARDYLALARRIEAVHPELRSCLLAAIEQRRELPFGRLGYLQEDVVRQALAHARKNAWPQIVSNQALGSAVLANVAGLALLTFVLFALAMQPSRPVGPAQSLATASTGMDSTLSLTVEPGNTEVELGTGLLVLARFTGPEPAEAALIFRSADGHETRLPMSKSLDDPVFGTRISSVEAPLDYRVELPGQTSPSYHVGVFEYPRLVRADARLAYPGYTGLEEKLVQDVRTISVVEGTRLTLICNLNKPVKSATLIEKEQQPLALVAQESQAAAYQVQFTCDKSRRLKLQLVDAEGRQSVKPADFAINVVPNKPPDLKLAFPSRDVEVSPLEETDVKASVYDDFGLRRVGLTYGFAGDEPQEIVLAENAAGKERRDLNHLIQFEALKAQPDQLLSYHFWAEDIGPDGNVRRTNSDMFFAEVRPFEEIFRQGEQPPGGQQQQQQQSGQNAQAAQKLAELQKEIINATWKLIRRENGAEPSETFAADALLVYQSQASALEQAQALAEDLQDAQSQAHAGAVIRSMTAAWHELEAAKDGPAIAPLQPALAAEQAAYQALLKLRAREHRVVRSQASRSASSSSSSQSRSQQQLQQLDLTNEENRYETQRTAQTREQEQQELQDRETRQVLSRLSELARRQNDLNERLKELQSALEEARSEAEREEVREQLKRLREEQQQVLRDTDELAGRMETPENQERMADARQQLEQTREQIQRASQALDENKVSQAAAAGTRAERDFEELRNEFRRQASNRFGEDVREMRDQARQLDEKQNELGQKLAGDENAGEIKPARGEKRSLRDGRDREAIAAELADQQRRLQELLERMKQTVQEAEQSEPLLSQQLYDAARKAQDQNPQRALEATEQSLERGLIDDARQQEQVARQGIGELRQGVERASESVLGDETEALRRAREELRRLSDELNDEIARNSPRGGPPTDGEGRERLDPDQPSQPTGSRTATAQSSAPNSQQNASRQPGSQQQGGDQKGSPRPGNQPPAEQAQAGAGPMGSKGRAGEPGGDQQASRGKGESPDAQTGQPSEGAQPSDNPSQSRSQPSQQARSSRPNQPGGRGGIDAPGPRRLAGPDRSDTTAGGGIEYSPLTGNDFLNWSDRLRDVEEMVDEPQLRAEAARIRDQARSIRAEFKRHSALPNWDLVMEQVSRPLAELRDRVAEELLRRTAKEVLVPLDRDPVPPQYSEKTRRYYERLGSGQ